MFFRIDADKISFSNNFHANSRAKKFAINYKVVGAMQQMGCGNTDITTLSVFLDLPTSAAVVTWTLREVEAVLGPVQILKKEESERDAVALEVSLHQDNDDLETHECTMEGHTHPPLSMIKGSYGV